MKRIIPVLLALFLIPGCGIQPTGTSYRQISTEEAVAMMEEESNYIILDVRTVQFSFIMAINIRKKNITINISRMPLIFPMKQLVRKKSQNFRTRNN